MTLIFIVICGYWHLPKPYGAKHFFKGPLRGRELCLEPEEKEIIKRE
jgi:hypothetical protein